MIVTRYESDVLNGDQAKLNNNIKLAIELFGPVVTI